MINKVHELGMLLLLEENEFIIWLSGIVGEHGSWIGKLMGEEQMA